MSYAFTPILEEQARQITGWRYEGEYALYNPDPAMVEQEIRNYLDPLNAYYSITNEEGELLGFCCFGPDARVQGGTYEGNEYLDVGMGMRPDLTGKGTGSEAIGAVLSFAARELAPQGFRATVAAFNKRALQLCKRAGFQEVSRFTRTEEKGEQEFVVLVRDAP